MKKTLTVNGKKYTGKQIAALFDKKNMTNGDDYIVSLSGHTFIANYRQVQDIFFAPVCEANEANAIALMPENSYCWEHWLSL